ncbi:Kelch repeat-containing protein [Paraglaciecola hydrolytica]|uniref:Galactose oxidase n=1 Tax=Paraglaciecola hydrolytica TaxID=1799789 RepID=A0A135ZZB3_9ALTE|nr:kelch repeat-containing protein [Paraglaciecola hydrolytica]KXI28319.1 hypothetical protein AX660_18290 [Paraglaciecola hydrolytica]
MTKLAKKYWLHTLFLSLLLTISACTTAPHTSTSQANKKLSLQTARYAHATATDGKLIYVFAGSQGGQFLSDIEIINPQTGAVKVLRDKVIPRRYFSAVWDGHNSIYLIGGLSVVDGEPKLERRVEVFDLLTQQITFAKPTPGPRRNSRSVFLDGRIYVMGGSFPNKENNYQLKSTATTAVYDIAQNTWTKLADMPSAKTTAAVVQNGKIYVAGGFNHSTALNVFERYDPLTNEWQTLSPLPQNMSAHSAAVLNNKLVLFGDYDNLNATLLYDFDSQTWSQPEINFQGTRHSTATTTADFIYVVGGNINSKGESLDVIQSFSL